MRPPNAVRLTTRMTELRLANEWVAAHHRHHAPVATHRFSLQVIDDQCITHGIAIVGKPVARFTCPLCVMEVSRLVTLGTPNACSALYGACARVAKALGVWRIQTFILDTEPGISLRASGWVLDGFSTGSKWANHPRPGKHRPHLLGPKQRWVLDVGSPCHDLPAGGKRR